MKVNAQNNTFVELDRKQLWYRIAAFFVVMAFMTPLFIAIYYIGYLVFGW